MTTYTLSNRQRKELLENGRVLRVAIPAIRQETDPVEFALAALPEIERGWIVSADECHVGVRPTERGAAGQLTGLLGSIQHADHRHTWHILVLCVVVELQAVRVARHSVGLTQWPGEVNLPGAQKKGSE